MLFVSFDFFKKFFQEHDLDQEMDRFYVSPYLGPNYLQRLSADDESHH